MEIQAATPLYADRAPALRGHREEPLEKKPPAEEHFLGRSERVERMSRVAGKTLHILTKLPKAYRYVPGLLRFALVDGLVAAVQVSAGALGILGVAGMGLAGALQIRDCLQDHDPIKFLAGSGEVARGVFVGGLSAETLFSLGPYQAATHSLTLGAGAVNGALYLGSGIMKVREGTRKGDGARRLEGLLETGMAASTLLVVAGGGPIPGLAAQVALSTARYAVINRKMLRHLPAVVGSRARQIWEDFKDIFLDEE